MDLWQQFAGSPEARAAAIAVVLPFIMQTVKPYLPTGKNDTPDGEAAENAYVPITTVFAGGLLGLVGAMVVVLSDTFQSNLVEYLVKSVAYGLGAGFAATGGVRAFKMTTRGDVAAQAANRYKGELEVRGITPPPTALLKE